MDRWINAVRAIGAGGAHLAVGTTNTRGIRFYAAYGFRALDEVPQETKGALWMGMKLNGGRVA